MEDFSIPLFLWQTFLLVLIVVLVVLLIKFLRKRLK